MPACMENYDPPLDDVPQDTADIIDPAKFEEQFVSDRETLKSRFTVPQFAQAQVPRVESLAEDFAALALRVKTEVDNQPEQNEAIRYLEFGFMMALRGMSYE